MRKVALALACVCVLSIPLLAATLADVTLPDTITVNNQTLVLNGLGLRSKMFVKVYVGGLYIEKKTTDPAAIIQADAPKRVVLQFLYDPSRDQMVDAFKEGFEGNAPGKFKAEVERWLAAQEGFKKGEQLVVTYVPGTGTTLAVKGKDKLTIPGLPFAQAVFSVWFGPKPPTGDLKNGMLGKK
jgi:Chalcone isomerase-like